MTEYEDENVVVDEPTEREPYVDEPTEREPYKDIDGNVIDAPIIPAYEEMIKDASNRADQDAIDEIMDEYHDARDELVDKRNQRERDRRNESGE